MKSAGTGPVEVILIGDSLHDKEVADALGVRCVHNHSQQSAPVSDVSELSWDTIDNAAAV